MLNFLGVAGILQLSWKGKYLSEKGWLKSFRLKRSIDKNGKPIPWCTYSFIQFIEPRLTKEMDAFEFGCGNSTLWYAERIKSIKAVEHDQQWANFIQPLLPVNAKIIFRSLMANDEYSGEVNIDGKKYHIIIIDGRNRNQCTYQAVQSLAADGIIVFDNSQISEYAPAMEFLHQQNFRRIDFFGMLPIVPTENCTTIFYRPNNCLNI